MLCEWSSYSGYVSLNLNLVAHTNSMFLESSFRSLGGGHCGTANDEVRVPGEGFSSV